MVKERTITKLDEHLERELEEVFMNKTRINEDSKQIWKEATEIFVDLELLRMTLLNIKISVAKIDTAEHRALATIADYIANSIDRIEERTKDIRDLSKSIGKEINRGILK